MVPGFFSKLVKGAPTNSSNNNSPSKGVSFESTNAFPASRTGGAQTNSSLVALQNEEHPTAKRRPSTSTPNSLSPYTNVTIGIIPPSPRTVNMENQPHNPPGPETQKRNEPCHHHQRTRSQDHPMPDRHAISLAVRPTTSSGSLSEDTLRTPSRGSPRRVGEWNTSSNISSPSSSRQLTPASSTGDLRGFVEHTNSNVHDSTPEPSFGIIQTRPRAGTNVERRVSNRSLRSQTQPPPLTVNKACTTTTAENGQDNTAQHKQGDAGGLIWKMTVESPTKCDYQGELLNTRPDTDTRSIHSATSSKKKRSWRRPSITTPTRKSSGTANPDSQVPAIPPLPTSPSKITLANSNGSKNSDKQISRHAASASVGSSLDVQTARSRLPSSNISEQHSDVSDFNGSSDESSASDNELDLNEDDIPVTGFAVASSKRNADFHELFPSIPDGDYLIEDYGCALQREILIQGRLYVSENHICFHANIFGWITDLSIPIYDVISLEKKMTAYVIPNAIQMITRQAKYTFASFLSRDTTYDVIVNIWRLAKPEVENMGNISRSASAQNIDTAGVSDGSLPAVNNVAPTRKVTQCACGKDGIHFSEIALESVLPGTPDKIYNLMFTSGFIKDFMRVDQKLIDLQISDWSPITEGSKLLCRNMSFIKPLNNSVGPKQTKCELTDETSYCDFDNYVVTITSTRTPDVPSGGVFTVKTRTCMMWASAISTRVVVTTQVEWTGRSFIKGLIERSAIEGQKVYHADLDKAMRMYIQEHQGEFVPQGVDPSAVAPAEAESPSLEMSLDGVIGGPRMSEEQVRKTREKERNQRSLQWAYDTFEGACGVAKRSASGAIELVMDAWDQSSSTTILYFVITLLVISNIWTLSMVGRREEVGRRKELKKIDEREKWIHGVVTGLWDELSAERVRPAPPLPGTSVSEDAREEIANIDKMLDAVEERVQRIRDSLYALD